MAEPRHLLGTPRRSADMVHWGPKLQGVLPPGGSHNPSLTKAAQFTLLLPKLKFDLGEKGFQKPLAVLCNKLCQLLMFKINLFE